MLGELLKTIKNDVQEASLSNCCCQSCSVHVIRFEKALHFNPLGQSVHQFCYQLGGNQRVWLTALGIWVTIMVTHCCLPCSFAKSFALSLCKFLSYLVMTKFIQLIQPVHQEAPSSRVALWLFNRTQSVPQLFISCSKLIEPFRLK